MGAYVHEGSLDQRIAAVADRFHGVVDVGQLYAVGATRRQIGRRIQSRRLIPLYRGVYAVGHRRITNPGLWLAAVRAMGPGALLSHSHAAALWELRPPVAGRINVTVASSGRRQRKGIRVHSTLDFPPDQVTIRDEIPVTTPTRTLVDLAGTAGRAQLSRAIEAAEYRGLLDVPSLLVVSAGHSGAAVIRELVSEELPHTRSDFEAAFVDLCDRYGFPRPVMNAVIAGHEVDAVWPDHKLIVELDSWRHHGTRAAFERDRERDADLHAAGYVSRRLTYRQVTARSGWVASRLRPSFAPRSRRGSSSLRRSAA